MKLNIQINYYYFLNNTIYILFEVRQTQAGYIMIAAMCWLGLYYFIIRPMKVKSNISFSATFSHRPPVVIDWGHIISIFLPIHVLSLLFLIALCSKSCGTRAI